MALFNNYNIIIIYIYLISNFIFNFLFNYIINCHLGPGVLIYLRARDTPVSSPPSLLSHA
jgi:hypothetical protein